MAQIHLAKCFDGEITKTKNATNLSNNEFEKLKSLQKVSVRLLEEC